MCSKYPGIKLDQRFREKKAKLIICRKVPKSSTQRQNNSFYVVKKRTAVKCANIKNAHTKRTKVLFFNVKYANLGRSGCVVVVLAQASVLYSMGHSYLIN